MAAQTQYSWTLQHAVFSRHMIAIATQLMTALHIK
jgi:hypothetical protein